MVNKSFQMSCKKQHRIDVFDSKLQPQFAQDISSGATIQIQKERRPISHHISRERERRPIAVRTLKRHASSSFKHATNDIKRPLISKVGRDVEISRGPVLYGKRPAEAEKSIRKLVRKPDGTTVSKVVKASEALAKSEENPDASNNEPTLEGHYELSPLLNKMLEAELQEILKKIREIEPVDPKDEKEKLVVSRFENKAGDDLVNTIGLNVTKRLLNIHNPLYVKMVFSGKPLRKDLVAFLKQYNICAFKRVGERGGIFAARMKTYQDFDDLCTNNNLKCGKICVTVTPCYQFTTRPSNLKTPFDPKHSKKISTSNKASQNEIKSSEKNTSVPQNKEKTQEETQKLAPIVALKSATSANQTNINKNQVTSTGENKIESKGILKATTAVVNKPATKTSEAQITDNKTGAMVPPKVAPAKVPAAKLIESKSTPEAKVQAKPVATANKSKSAAEVQTKPAENKPVAKVTTAVANQANTRVATQTTEKSNTAKALEPASANQNITAKVTPTKANQTPAKDHNAAIKAQTTAQTKAVTNKTTAQNKPNTTTVVPKQNVTVNKNIANKTTTQTKATPIQTSAQNKPNTTGSKQNIANKTVANKLKVTSTRQPSKVIKKQSVQKGKIPPKKKANDLDELDDHDILALLSEGIVLDECSGSDED